MADFNCLFGPIVNRMSGRRLITKVEEDAITKAETINGSSRTMQRMKRGLRVEYETFATCLHRSPSLKGGGRVPLRRIEFSRAKQDIKEAKMCRKLFDLSAVLGKKD